MIRPAGLSLLCVYREAHNDRSPVGVVTVKIATVV